MFQILCIVHTTDGMNSLDEGVWVRNTFDENGHHLAQVQLQRQWREFIKQCLALEDWLHDDNQQEVDQSYSIIVKVLNELKIMFLWGRNGYKIPKFHGIMKMKYYIQLF